MEKSSYAKSKNLAGINFILKCVIIIARRSMKDSKIMRTFQIEFS